MSEATEASTAYVIGKVLEETLGLAKNASTYDEVSSDSADIRSTTLLLLSNEIMLMIFSCVMTRQRCAALCLF